MGTTKCGNECVDTKTDDRNCGMCGTKCGTNKVCSMGACADDCAMGTAKCGNSCVNQQTDRTNCGGCGTVCKDGEICSAGKCAVSCQQGLTKCSAQVPDGGASDAAADGSSDGGQQISGDYCANLQTDNNNCGGCGIVCAGQQMCSAGSCVSSCAQGQTRCIPDGGAPYCANTQTDNNDCGSCGNACAGGKTCAAGQCVSGVSFFAQYTASMTFKDALPGTSMTLTWDGTNFWSSSGGSASGNRLARYDANGANPTLYQPNIDFRSVFTVGGSGATVYSRGYSSTQIQRQTAPGTFTNQIALTGGTLDSQSAVVFNTAGTEYVATNTGTVTRWNANSGALIGTVTLQGFGTLNSENTYPQNRGVAVVGTTFYLTYSAGQLSAWDTNGKRLGITTLVGAGTSFDSYFSLSYARGMVWILDAAGGTWRGYNVGL
jgi:hypothetical protein